jgi:hypothetical protein
MCAGLSLALGAFLAGLLLAETEYALQVESDIAPYKGLLMGLFFMTVGKCSHLGVCCIGCAEGFAPQHNTHSSCSDQYTAAAAAAQRLLMCFQRTAPRRQLSSGWGGGAAV